MPSSAGSACERFATRRQARQPSPIKSMTTRRLRPSAKSLAAVCENKTAASMFAPQRRNRADRGLTDESVCPTLQAGGAGAFACQPCFWERWAIAYDLVFMQPAVIEEPRDIYTALHKERRASILLGERRQRRFGYWRLAAVAAAGALVWLALSGPRITICLLYTSRCV